MDIGEIKKLWESEPLEEPAFVPEEPAEPVREIEPAEKEPEKVG
jgi:hypothetical protein